MRFIILFLLFGCFISNAYSQKETNFWFFGFNAGINFNSGAPASFSGGSVNSFECSASISDNIGNLLFYPDGKNVFTKNNTLMPNGVGLLGDQSTTQGALIIRKPNSTNLYILFSINTGCVSPFSYSVIDMNKNGGLGEVVQKNIILLQTGNYFEKLTATKHSNNRDIWVNIIGVDSLTKSTLNLYCFLLTPYGVMNTPIVSALGDISTSLCYGQLKTSPDGQYLAYASENGVSIVNFNKKSGKINSINSLICLNNNPYGLEFSPDSRLLYLNKMQIEISNGNKINLGYPTFSQFQMALDKKIYFINYDSTQIQDPNFNLAKINSKSLSVINSPNLTGLSANITYNNISLSPDSAKFGLPNFPSYLFYHPEGEFTYQNDCVGDIINFNLVNSPVLDSIRWIFLDDNSNSTLIQPTHIYSASGTYDVNVITYQNGIADTTNQSVTINGVYPNFFGQSDTSLCSNNRIFLGVSYPYLGHYLWNTGDTTSGIYVREEGEYWLRITDICAIYSDTIKVTREFCEPEVFIPNVFTPNDDGINDLFEISF